MSEPGASGSGVRAGDAQPVIGRREWLRRALGGASQGGIGAGIVYGVLGLRPSRSPVAGARGELGVVRPPGSQDEDAFLAACLRCTRCAEACPPGCIRLFEPESGVMQGTPYLLTAEKACTLCLECGKACPTDAIRVLERLEDADMGEAEVDERLCVSHNGSGVCGACHTVCPLRDRALTQDYRNAPSVHAEFCTGCGLCEEACIVRERKAIRVRSRRRMPAGGARGVAA